MKTYQHRLITHYFRPYFSPLILRLTLLSILTTPLIAKASIDNHDAPQDEQVTEDYTPELFSLVPDNSSDKKPGLCSSLVGFGQTEWQKNYSAGVDISKYQKVTSWSEFENSDNLSFLFIKATEGVTIRNPFFPQHWKDSNYIATPNHPKMYRGAYHFYHPADDPIEQADFFLSTIGELEIIDLPPVLDLESFDKLKITDLKVKKTVAKNVLTWLRYVEQKTHRTPILYTYRNFWITLGSIDPAFAHYPLFIASYNENLCPLAMAPWTNWTFWQYSESGTISGIENHTDLDIFNGNENDLLNFIDSSKVPFQNEISGITSSLNEGPK